MLPLPVCSAMATLASIDDDKKSTGTLAVDEANTNKLTYGRYTYDASHWSLQYGTRHHSSSIIQLLIPNS